MTIYNTMDGYYIHFSLSGDLSGDYPSSYQFSLSGDLSGDYPSSYNNQENNQLKSKNNELEKKIIETEDKIAQLELKIAELEKPNDSIIPVVAIGLIAKMLTQQKGK